MGKKLLSLLLTFMMVITILPAMSRKVDAETYNSNVNVEQLRKGDILESGATFLTTGITVTLQGGGSCIKFGETYTPIGITTIDNQDVINISNEGAINITDPEFTAYPYANGKVDSWVVVSVDGNAITLTGYAAPEPVSYLDADGNEQSCSNYTVVSSSNSYVAWNDGWYVVKGNVTCSNYIYVNSGTVNLILCDGAKLNVGLLRSTGGNLTIYAQSTGNNMGSLKVEAEGDNNCGIDMSENSLTIVGGNITAIGPAGAISGSVKNAIPGTGWTNTAGNEGREEIAANTGGQSLSSYKKVQFPTAPLDPVSYLDADGSTKTCSDYTVVTNSTETFDDGKWYVVKNTVTVSNRITTNGAANLILCDGAALTAQNGVAVDEGKSLTIYGQTNGTGALAASGDGSAGIGSSGGTIIINGGTINANGSNGLYGNNITIRNSEVISEGNAYGIRGLDTLDIINSTVTASSVSQAGISGKKGITINDSTVAAESETIGIITDFGSSGKITINNSIVTVNNSINGIQCYNILAIDGDSIVDTNGSNLGIFCGGSGSLIINDGSLTASGASGGAIYGSVINKIDGTGWTNTAGTTDKAYIPVSESGQTIPNTIKKVQFPAVTYNVTITPGENMTKTTDSGDATQENVPVAITPVVYTADTNYYFPEGYSVTPVNGIEVTRDSNTQITVSGIPTANTTIILADTMLKPIPLAPTTAAAVDCTSVANNDGKLTGVTADMEYKKSDAESWTAGTGSDITDLGSGTYYVRYKETETTQASQNQELTIKGYVSYTVTFKVVNGSWNEGEGEDATKDKTVTLDGIEGEIKLSSDQIPTVGNKPADTYKVGSWDVTPSTETVITENTTYTYTYALKDPATVTEVPTAKENLIYTGEDQALVNDGTATGGTMKYALGTDTTTVPTDWSDSIPKGNKTGTYYVWYKAVGDTDHRDSDPKAVTAKISAVDKTALQNAINEATAYYNTIKDNTDYGEAATVLNTAITNAKEKLSDDTTAQDVNDAINSVKEALNDAKAAVKEIDDLNAAYVVKQQIENLPAPAVIKTSDKDAIEAARAAYNGLTDDQKAKVPAETIEKLVAAEKALDKALFNEYKETKKTEADNMAQEGDSKAVSDLIKVAKDAISNLAYDETKTFEENKAAVDAIITQLTTDLVNQRAADVVNSAIAALPADITLENEDAVKAAREAYENLSDDQKALVNPDMLTKLGAAETAIADLKAAKAVDEKIAALPAAEDVTLDDKSDIEVASEAYKDLTNDQKALVNPEMKTKLDNVKAALADLEAAKTVTDLINNLPNPITLDSEDAIREAESAYNGLTEDQKKKITAETLQKLDDAKNALADLKAVKAVEDKIKALITKYPEISKLSSENEEAVSDINDVLDAYNKLTETQIEKADQDLLFTLDAYENAVLKYTVIQGEGSSWMRGDYKGALFVLKRNVNDVKTFELFSYARVNGKEIEEDKDYTAEAGSVKITLKPSYLNTLSVGEHTLTVVFKDDRMIDIKFKVLARPTPVTPDYVPPRTGIEH